MIWKKGDIITQGRYDRVKSSYAGLPKSAVVHESVTVGADYVLYSLDKTKDEILNLLKTGYIVYILRSPSEGEVDIEYVISIQDTGVSTNKGTSYQVQPNGGVSYREDFGSID